MHLYIIKHNLQNNNMKMELYNTYSKLILLFTESRQVRDMQKTDGLVHTFCLDKAGFLARILAMILSTASLKRVLFTSTVSAHSCRPMTGLMSYSINLHLSMTGAHT